VEQLPDYGKVSFPDFDPVPLPLLLPEAHSDDLQFISHFFQLDPKKRLSASDGLQLNYFQKPPLPTESTTLYCLDVLLGPDEHSTKPRKGQPKPISSVEEFLDIAAFCCQDL
jgi:serine/threonine protein kinase